MNGSRRARIVLWTFAVVVILLVALPSLLIIPLSFSSGQTLRFPQPGFSLRWYGVFFDPHQEWMPATLDSLEVAIGAAAAATLLGTLGAFGLVRGRFRGRTALLAFFLSPLMVPVVVLAIGMFFVVLKSRIDAFGAAPALIAAHTVLGVPLVVLNVAASLSRVDPDLEYAAIGLGASQWRAFRRITLPIILPGVIAGAFLAFVTSWDEVVIAIFLTNPYFRTLPVVMWGEVRYNLDPTIAVVATALIAVTTTMLVGFLSVRRRRA